ncbi:unnamed protein product, partial [Pocillopora meandrina]
MRDDMERFRTFYYQNSCVVSFRNILKHFLNAYVYEDSGCWELPSYCRSLFISRNFGDNFAPLSPMYNSSRYKKYTYTFSPDLISDIDECSKNSHNCSYTTATCTNTRGSFKCICKPGFSGDGHNCTDINESANDTHNCSRDNATCSNTAGSFNCSCNPGFTGNGHICRDIGEGVKNTSNSSNENATCKNSERSSKSTCELVFSGNGHNCTNNEFSHIDEFVHDTHICSRDNATHTNTEGLFNCFCNPGFSGDGHNCADHWVRSVDFIADIDECVTSTHNCSMDNCDSRNNSTSTNTEGSFNCSCKQGFTGNGHKCE